MSFSAVIPRSVRCESHFAVSVSNMTCSDQFDANADINNETDQSRCKRECKSGTATVLVINEVVNSQSGYLCGVCYYLRINRKSILYRCTDQTFLNVG